MFCFHPLIGYLHLEKHLLKSLFIFDRWFIFLWLLSQTLLSLYELGVTRHFDEHLRGNFVTYTLRGSGPWSHDLVIVRSQKVAALFAVTRKGGEREGKREGEGTRSCWNKIWSPETRTRECLELSTSGISHNLPPTPSSVTPLPAQVRAPQSSHSPRPDPPGEDQAFRGDASYLK